MIILLKQCGDKSAVCVLKKKKVGFRGSQLKPVTCSLVSSFVRTDFLMGCVRTNRQVAFKSLMRPNLCRNYVAQDCVTFLHWTAVLIFSGLVCRIYNPPTTHQHPQAEATKMVRILSVSFWDKMQCIWSVLMQMLCVMFV